MAHRHFRCLLLRGGSELCFSRVRARARGGGGRGAGGDCLAPLGSIEKKRAVIPALAEAVEGQDGRQLDWEYFYGLLFTSANLKLVHVACHKKTTHGLSCDPRRVYRPRAEPRRKRAARKRL